jgi:tRNA 5-methylaminomethyl-2-thiouridine biosynthesis bifunctional protein
MVSRDHFPVMGCVHDVEALFTRYAVLQQQSKDKPSLRQHYWQTTPAPFMTGYMY